VLVTAMERIDPAAAIMGRGMQDDAGDFSGIVVASTAYCDTAFAAPDRHQFFFNPRKVFVHVRLAIRAINGFADGNGDFAGDFHPASTNPNRKKMSRIS